MFAHTFRMERNQTETTNGMYGEHYRKKGTKKIHIQPILQPILHHVDEKREEYFNNLKTVIATISNLGMIKFCEKWFKTFKIHYELFNPESVDAPTKIVASLITNRRKKTV